MRFTIKAKLVVAFGLLIAVTIGCAGFGMHGVNEIASMQSALLTGPVRQDADASKLVHAFDSMSLANADLLLSSNSQDIKVAIEAIEHHHAEFNEALKLGEEHAPAEFKEKWAEIREFSTGFAALSSRIRDLALTGQHDQAVVVNHTEGAAAVKTLNGLTGELASMTRAAIAAEGQASEAASNNTFYALMAAAAGGVLLSIAAALWIGLSITRGLAKIGAAADAVAIGDLDQRIEVKTNDEIKDLVETINVMTSNLRNTANVADSIAAGDLSHDPKPLSDKDALGLSMLAMVTNLRANAAIADQIANGDLTVSPRPLSDKDTLGLALESMVERLRGVVGDALAASDNVSAGS
ncbi:HAMP domain-containing protein, partial [Rhizobium sp. LjRoot30]|uniref:HAMP domain-containing protein n=1 Tax=Rhizobium sp. LjRoot30 TaxID=3342320 RepID=UPI003F501BB2